MRITGESFAWIDRLVRSFITSQLLYTLSVAPQLCSWAAWGWSVPAATLTGCHFLSKLLRFAMNFRGSIVGFAWVSFLSMPVELELVVPCVCVCATVSASERLVEEALDWASICISQHLRMGAFWCVCIRLCE